MNRSPFAFLRTPPSPRTASVTSLPRASYGKTAPVGWNWTISISMSSAPARYPIAYPSPVPLELVPGFEMLVALPTEGFDPLIAAITPHGEDAVAYARAASERYHARAHADARSGGSAYRAYASAIAQHERRAGRRAHSFELNVQVLPLTQRGVWWIGALTVAVTDSLRSDVVAFDAAIAPVIADIA